LLLQESIVGLFQTHRTEIIPGLCCKKRAPEKRIMSRSRTTRERIRSFLCLINDHAGGIASLRFCEHVSSGMEAHKGERTRKDIAGKGS